MTTTSFTKANRYALEGTSGQGYIDATYADLVRVFGEPDEGSGDGKTRVEWAIAYSDGMLATVYDWKEYHTPVELVTEWAVGGCTRAVIDRVEKTLRDSVRSPR